MNNEWNLSKLYKGLDDKAYAEDFKKAEALAKDYVDTVKKMGDVPSVADVENVLRKEEELTATIMKLIFFLELSSSVDSENGALLAEMNKASRIIAGTEGASAKMNKLYAKIPSLDEYCKSSKIITEYKHNLAKIIKDSKYLLSDAEEELYAQMDMTAGTAWGNLQSFLTSTVKVDYDGKEITLSDVRNLAYDADPEVRKKAYDAEIACYAKIADSIAYSLNNIKLQVNMISRKRGFASPLEQVLINSDMKKETLDAMMSAIEDHLPNVRKYFLGKAKALGHKGALPWYDLFAPVGKNEKKYTIEETKDVLVNTFKSFTLEMSDMMKEAFENEWIDFYPRNGKVGGAFDCGVSCIKESRVLTNFDGTFGSVDTLAHELGHAFHDRQVQDNSILNQDYCMQVAETASTFNETHLNNYFIKNASSNEEKLSLLEGLLREQTQCIVDIYSRYVFETSVFEKCDDSFLMKDDLCALMLEAQKKAYGDAIEESTLHPYMWACKSHYYSSGLSFYNFPYAFGTLFAAGLYDLFEKEGAETFVPKYKAMLKATPTVTVEEAGALMGIDLTKKKFWDDSLKMIERDIEEYCSLS